MSNYASSSALLPLRTRVGRALSERLDTVLPSARLGWALVALGVLLRVVQYASGRSLWSDEAMLALNLIERSFGDFWRPLAYYQFAPLGFLYAQKSALELFGTSEFALRLVPLLSSCASLVLMYVLARRWVDAVAANLTLAFFALSDQLIYYATENKQYSTDVLVTLVICYVTLRFIDRPTPLTFTGSAILGAGLVWMSHPAVFVLAGGGLTVLLHFWNAGRNRQFFSFLFVIAAWVASFAVTYFAFLKAPRAGLDYQFSLLLPTHSWNLARSAASYMRLFFGVFSETLGYVLTGLCALVFFAGLMELWRSTRPGKPIVGLTLLVAAAASVGGFYPARGRAILYLAPFLLLAMGAGTALLWRASQAMMPALGVVLLSLLFLHPVMQAGYHLVGKPMIRQELKPILQLVEAQAQPGDIFYVFHNAEAAMKYYRHRGFLANREIVIGDEPGRNVNRYLDFVDQFRGKPRVWFIFAHSVEFRGVDAEHFIVAYLNRIGSLKFDHSITNEFIRPPEIRKTGASAYLFDLSQAPEKAVAAP